MRQPKEWRALRIVYPTYFLRLDCKRIWPGLLRDLREERLIARAGGVC
jgi:hypothetical protein